VGPGPALEAPTIAAEAFAEARRAAGLSKPALARLMGVSGTQLTHWESSKQRVPPARAEQARAILASLESAAPHVDVHRVAPGTIEATALELVAAAPGQSKRQLAAQIPGDTAKCLRTLDALVDAGRLVRSPVERPGPRGSVRHVGGLFLPGQAPASPAPARPVRFSDEEVELSMLEVVRAAPGITRNAALDAPQAVGDRARRWAAMKRLVEKGRLKPGETTIVTSRGVRRRGEGLFPGVP
jgi:transcriptional regulator with XRE-family HTH domain